MNLISSVFILKFVADNKVNLSDEDFGFANLDPDFSEELENTTPEEIVLTDFTDVDVYICCDNAGKLMRILQEVSI